MNSRYNTMKLLRNFDPYCLIKHHLIYNERLYEDRLSLRRRNEIKAECGVQKSSNATGSGQAYQTGKDTEQVSRLGNLGWETHPSP